MEPDTNTAPGSNITLEEVFEVIRSERAYQKFKISENTLPNPDKSLGEYALLLQYYVSRVTTKWAKGEPSLQDIRKIAAISVACMERYGSMNLVNPFFDKEARSNRLSAGVAEPIDFRDLLHKAEVQLSIPEYDEEGRQINPESMALAKEIHTKLEKLK